MFNNQAKWNSEQHYRDPNRKKGYSSTETGNTCSVSAYHLLGPSCTLEYSSDGCDIITQNLERYIKSTKSCNAETEWFIKEIRYKIFCLHEYNLKVAEAGYQKKYPLTPYLRKLLIQYVILECRYFQRSSRFVFSPSELHIQKRLLRLLFIVFGDYFRGLQVEPLQLSTECSKEVIRLFVELKSQFDIESPILDKIVERLLQRIGTLEPLKFLQGKSLPCPGDSLLATPDFVNIRRKVIKDLWTNRLDLHQQLEGSDNDCNVEEEEEVVNRSSLVPTIQLEDDNSHKVFWDTEVDTRVRWFKSQNFTSSNGMPFIETVQLDSSDEESTSGHSHCDIVNTIDVNISNNDLISSHQTSPYVVAFNVSDGDLGKGVILSNSKKTSSQFIVNDVKERKKTVFPRKPFLDNNRTLSEHSGSSGRDNSREKDKDLKVQATKPCLIQSTSNLHCTINISNEIFTGFEKFLSSHDSEYSYKKSTKDYKETTSLHSKHQTTPYQKGASTAQEKRKEKFLKRDNLPFKHQSLNFFGNLISKLDKSDRSNIQTNLGSDFKTLERFGSKLAVKTKISAEVSEKSRPPSDISKNISIEISSDEEDGASTSIEDIKLEKSVRSSEVTEAEKVALKHCGNVIEAKDIIENKHVAETVATENYKPPESRVKKDLHAASSKFSSGNSEVIEANKSVTTLCDKGTINESENSKNVVATIELSLPKGNVDDTIETINEQISDKDAENLHDKSHTIAKISSTEKKELPETFKSTEEIQNITSQEYIYKGSIEPSLLTENVRTDIVLCSELQNVKEAQDSILEIGDGTGVINKVKISSKDRIIEASNENKTVDELGEIHGEEKEEAPVNEKHTSEFENIIRSNSTHTSDEAHFDSINTKSTKPTSENDPKKVEKLKSQTENIPTESSMLSILPGIEINELEKILSEEKDINIVESNHTTENEVRTEDSIQFNNVVVEKSTENKISTEEGFIQFSLLINNEISETEGDRVSGLEKSDEVCEKGKNTVNTEAIKTTLCRDVQINETEKTRRISCEYEKDSVEELTPTNESTHNEEKLLIPCSDEKQNTPDENQLPAKDLQMIKIEKSDKKKSNGNVSGLENQKHIVTAEDKKSTESNVNKEVDDTVKPKHIKSQSVKLNISTEDISDEKIEENLIDGHNISNQMTEDDCLVNESAVEHGVEHAEENPPKSNMSTEQSKVAESSIIRDSIDVESDIIKRGELNNTNFIELNNDYDETINKVVADKPENNLPVNKNLPTPNNKNDCCSRKKYKTQKPANLGPEDENEENFKIVGSNCADSHTTVKILLEDCSNSIEGSCENVTDLEHSSNTDTAVKDKDTDLHENGDITEMYAKNADSTVEEKLNYTNSNLDCKVNSYIEQVMNAKENDNKQLQEVTGQDENVIKINEESVIENDHTIQVAKVANVLEDSLETANDATFSVKEADIETLEQQHKATSMTDVCLSENTKLQPEIYPCETDAQKALPCTENSSRAEHFINAPTEDIISEDQDVLTEENMVNVSKSDENLPFSSKPSLSENEILSVDRGNVTPSHEIIVRDSVTSCETINTESYFNVQENFVPEVVKNIDVEKLKTDCAISETSSTEKVNSSTCFELASNIEDSVALKDGNLQDKVDFIHNELDHINLENNIPVASEVEIEYNKAYEEVVVTNADDCSIQGSSSDTPTMIYESSNSSKSLNVLKTRGRKQNISRRRRAPRSRRMTSVTNGLHKEVTSYMEDCSDLAEGNCKNVTNLDEDLSNVDTAFKEKEADLNVNEDITEKPAVDAKGNDDSKQLQEVSGEDGGIVRTTEEFLIENNHTIQVKNIANVLEDSIETANDATFLSKTTNIETLKQHKAICMTEMYLSENTELQPEIYQREADIQKTLPCAENSIEAEHLINTPTEDILPDQCVPMEENNVIFSKSDESLPFSNEVLTPENQILPVDHGKITPSQEIIVNDFVASYETINTEFHSDLQEKVVPEIVTNFDLEKLKTDCAISETSNTEKVDSGTDFELSSNLEGSAAVKDVSLHDRTDLVHNELDHVNLEDNIPFASEVEIEYSETYEEVAVTNVEDHSTQNSSSDTPKMINEKSSSRNSLNIPLRARGRKQRAPKVRRASVSNKMTSVTNSLHKEITDDHTKGFIESNIVPSLTTDNVSHGGTYLDLLANTALSHSQCDTIITKQELKTCVKPKKHERKPRQKRKYNEEGVKRLTRSSSRKSSLSCEINVKPHDFLCGATTLPKSVNVFNQYVSEPAAVSERSDESNDRLLIDDDGLLLEKEQNVSVPAFNDDQMEDSLQLQFEEESTKNFPNFQSNIALDYNFKPFRTKAEKKAYSTNSLYVSLEKLHTREMFENVKHHRSRSFDINMLRAMHSKKEMSKLTAPLVIEPVDVDPLEIEPAEISIKEILSMPKNFVSKSLSARRKSKSRDTLLKTSSTPNKLLTEVTNITGKLKFEEEKIATREMITGGETVFDREIEINGEPRTLLKNKKGKTKLPDDGKVNLDSLNELDFEKTANGTKKTLNKEQPPLPLDNKKGKTKLPAKGKRNQAISRSSENLHLANELNFEKQLDSTEINPNNELPQISVKNKRGKAKTPTKGKRNRAISDFKGNLALTDLNSKTQLDSTETTSHKELLDGAQKNKTDEEKLPVKVTRNKSIPSFSESLSLTNKLNSGKPLDSAGAIPNKELLKKPQENKKGKAKLPAKGKKTKIVSDSNDNLPLTNKLNFEKQLNNIEVIPNKELLPASLKNKTGKTKSPVTIKTNRGVSLCAEDVPLTDELNRKQLTSTEVTSNKELLPASTDIKVDRPKTPAKSKRSKSVSDSAQNVPLTKELNAEIQLKSTETAQNELLQSSQKNKTNKTKGPTNIRRNKSVPDFAENLPVNTEINFSKQLDTTEIIQSKVLRQATLKNKAKLPVNVKKSKSVPDSIDTVPLNHELVSEKQLGSREMIRSKELPQASLKDKTDKTNLPFKVTRNKSVSDSNESLVINELSSEKQLDNMEEAQNIEMLQSPPKNKTNKAKLPVKVKKNKSVPDSNEKLPVNNEMDSEKQLDSTQIVQNKELPQVVLKNKTDQTKLPIKGKKNKSVPTSSENLPVNNEMNSEKQLDITQMAQSKELPQAFLKNKTDKGKLPVKGKKNKSVPDSSKNLSVNNEMNSEKELDITVTQSKELPQAFAKNKTDKAKLPVKVKRSKSVSCHEILPVDNELGLGRLMDGTEMTPHKETDNVKLPVKVKRNKFVPDSDENLPVTKELSLVKQRAKLTANVEPLQVPLEIKKGKAKLPVKGKSSKITPGCGENLSPISDFNFDKQLDNMKSSPNKEPLQESSNSKREKHILSFSSKTTTAEIDCLEDLPLAILKKQFEKNEHDDYDELPLILRMNLKPSHPEKKQKEKSSPNFNKKTSKTQENRNVKIENKDSSKIKTPSKKSRKRDHLGDVKEENALRCVDVEQKMDNTLVNTDSKRIKLNIVETEKMQKSTNENVFTLPLKLRRKSVCKDTLNKFSGGLPSPIEILARNVEDIKPTSGLDKKYMSPPKLRVKTLTDDEKECFEQKESSPEPVTTPTSLESLFKCKNTIISTTEKLKKKLLGQDSLIDSLQIPQDTEIKNKSIEEKETPLQTSNKIEIPSVTVEKSVEEKGTSLQTSDKIELHSITVEKPIEEKGTSLQTSDIIELPHITVEKLIEEKVTSLQTSDKVELPTVTIEKSMKEEETSLQTSDKVEQPFITIEKSIDEKVTSLQVSDKIELSSVTVEKSSEVKEIPLQTSKKVELLSLNVEKSIEEIETPLKTSDEIELPSVTVEKSIEVEEIRLQTSNIVELPSLSVEQSIEVKETPLSTSDEIELPSATVEPSFEDKTVLLQTSDKTELVSDTAKTSIEEKETPLETSCKMELRSVTIEKPSIDEEKTPHQTSDKMELCKNAVEDVGTASENVIEIKETQDVSLNHNEIEKQRSEPLENHLPSVQTEIVIGDINEGVCNTSHEVEVVQEPIDFSLSSNDASETTLQKDEDIAPETDEALVSKEQVNKVNLSTENTDNASGELHELSDMTVPQLNKISASVEPEKLTQNEANSPIIENHEEMPNKNYPEEKNQINGVILSEKQENEVSSYLISTSEKLEEGISPKLADPLSTPGLVKNKVLDETIEQIPFEIEKVPEVGASQGQNENTLFTDSVHCIEKSQTNINMDSPLSTSTKSKTWIKQSKQANQPKRKQKIENIKAQKVSHQISPKNKQFTNIPKIQTKRLKMVTPKATLCEIEERTVNKNSKVSKNSEESKVPTVDLVKETPDTNKDDSQMILNHSVSSSLVETADISINKMSDQDLNDPQQDLPSISVSREVFEVNSAAENVPDPPKLDATCSLSSSAQLSSQKKERKSIESIITQLKENNVSTKSEVVVENLKKKLKEKIHCSPKEAPLILLKKGDEKFSPIIYRNKRSKHSKTAISTPIFQDNKQETEVIIDTLSNEVPLKEPNKTVVDEPTSKVETAQSLEITRPESSDSTEHSLPSVDKITDNLSLSESSIDVQTKSNSESSFLDIDSSRLEQDSPLEVVVSKVTGDLLPSSEIPAEKATIPSTLMDQSECTRQDGAIVVHDASMPVSEPIMDSNEVKLISDAPSFYELSESETCPISTNQHISMVLDISSSSNKESICVEEPTESVGSKILENSSKYIESKAVYESTTEPITTVHEESMPLQSSLPIYQEPIPLNDSGECSISPCQDQSTNYLMSLAQDETITTSSTYEEPALTSEFTSCLEQKDSTLITNSLPHYQESTAIQGEPTHYLSTAQDSNYLITTDYNESVVVDLLSNHQNLSNINESINCSLPTNQDESLPIEDSFNCHVDNSKNNRILNESESVSTNNVSPHPELVSKDPTDSIGQIFTVDSMINDAPITDVSFQDFVASTHHTEAENQLKTEDFSVTCKEEPLPDLLLTYEESVSDVKSDILSLVSESEPDSQLINEPVTSDLSVEFAASHSSLHLESPVSFREFANIESEHTNVLKKSKNLNLPVIEMSDISSASSLTVKRNKTSFINAPTQPNFGEQVNETMPTDRSFSKYVKKGLSLPVLETTTSQVVKRKSKDLKKKSSIKASETAGPSSSDVFNSVSTNSSVPTQNWKSPIESLISTIKTFDDDNYEHMTGCGKQLNCHNVIKKLLNGGNKRSGLNMPTLETSDTVSAQTLNAGVEFKREIKQEIHSPVKKVSPIKRVVRFNLPEKPPTNLPVDSLKRKNPFKSLPTIGTFENHPVPDLVDTSNLKVENETETNLDESKLNTSTTVPSKKGLDLPILDTSDFTDKTYNKSPKKANKNLDMPILETSPPAPIASKKYRRSSSDVSIVQHSISPTGVTTRTRKKSLDLPIIQPLNITPEEPKISSGKSCLRKSDTSARDILSRALVGISLSSNKISDSTEPSTSTSEITEVTSADDFLLNVSPKYTVALSSSDSSSMLNFQQTTPVEQSKIVSNPVVSSASDPMGESLSDTVPVSKPMEYEEFKKWITGVVPEPLIKLQDENFENCLVSDISTEAKGIPEVHTEVEVYCEKPEPEDKSKYFSGVDEVSTEFLNTASQQATSDSAAIGAVNHGDDDQIPFPLPSDNIDAPDYTGEVIIEHDMRDELIGEIIKSPSFINDSEEGSSSAYEVPTGILPQVLSCLDPDVSKPGPSGCQATSKRQETSGSNLLNFQDISPTKFSQALELMSPKISYSTSNFGGESSNVMLSTKMIDDSQSFAGCTPRTEIRCSLEDTTDHTYHHLGGPLLSMFSHNFNNDPLEQSSDNFNSHLPDLSKAPGGEIGESQNTSEPYLVNFSLSDFENINLIDLSTSENKSDRKKIDISNVPLMEEMELPDKTWQQFTSHNPKVVVVMNERCSTPTYSMSEDIFGGDSNSEHSQSTDSQSPIRPEEPKAETKSAVKGKSIVRPKDNPKLAAKEEKGSLTKKVNSKGETAMKTTHSVPPPPNCQIKVKQNLFPENRPSSSFNENGSNNLETNQNKTLTDSVTNAPGKPSQEASNATNHSQSKKKGSLMESEEVPVKRFKMSKKGAGNAAAVSNIFDAVKFRQRKSTTRYTSELAAISKKPFDKMGSFLDSSARTSDTSKFLDEFNQKVSSEKETLKKTTTKSTPTRSVSPQQEPQNKESNLKSLTKKISPKYSKESQQDSLTDNLLNYGLKLRFCLKGSHNVRVEPVETSSQEVREAVDQSKLVESAKASSPRMSSSTGKPKPETSKKSSNVNISHVDYKTKDSAASDHSRKVKMVSREADTGPCLTDNLLNHNLLRRELSRPSYKSRPPEPPGPFLNYTSRPSTSGTSKSVYDSRSKEKYPPCYENHYKPKYPPDSDRELPDSSKPWNYTQDPNRRTYSKNVLTNDFSYREYNRPPPDPSKRSSNGVHNHSIDHILNRDSTKYKQYKSDELAKRSSSTSEEDRMRKMRKGESEFDSLYKTGNQNPNFMLKVTKSNRLKLVKQRNRFYDESKSKPDYYKEHDFGRVSPRELREGSGSLHRSYPGGSFMDREKKFRGKADYSGSLLDMPRNSMSSDRVRGNSNISDFRDMRTSRESLESMDKKNERRHKDSFVMGEVPHGSLSPERSKGSSTSMDRAMKEARDKSQDDDKKNKPGRQKEWFEIFNEKFKEYDYGSSAPKFW